MSQQQPPYNPYYGGQPSPNPYQGAPPPGQPPPYGFQPGGQQPPYGFQAGQQPPFQTGQQPPPFVPPPMPHQSGYAYAGGDDPEAAFPKSSNLQFSSVTVRAAFIRKVFMLLTVMLMIVVALISLFLFEPNCKRFVRSNTWPYWLSYAVFLVTYFAIICCEGVRRHFPGNMICLLLLTLSMGYMTAMISSFYDVPIVFMAAAICVVCCGSIMLFASQTKYDFTSWIGVMFVISMVLFLFGMVAIIVSIWFPSVRFLYVVYAALAALVFMVYLAIDTQMVVGGKRYEYSPEDYIVAAVQLFLDIIYIFIYLLQIIGYINKER